MSKFVTLVLEPRFKDEYGEYANLPVFNAHGDVVGYTGGEVPETGNPCEFYVMDEEGFPVCHSASENAALRQQLADVTESMGRVEERCAKLREQTELLVTLLRNDCDIEASWDGLRKFWYIGLTESGCLMRDRACKAEAENAKLRELCADLLKGFDCGWPSDVCGDCERDGMGMPIGGCKLENRARELGIEVDG